MKARLRRGVARVAIAASLVVGVPTAGYAAMAVIDASALAKLSEQLNSMKQQIEAAFEQIEWLTTLSEQLRAASDLIQEQIDAIGAIGQIALPTLNLEKLTGQIVEDIQCLKLDLENLMPNLDFDDLDFATICAGRDAYQTALWVDPEAIDGQGPVTWQARKIESEAVQARREAIAKETATSGLAQADLAATDVAETNQRATEDLEAAVKAAQNANERLAVLAQGTVLTNRQLVHQNQLLAQLVKIQSVQLMMDTLPLSDHPLATETEAPQPQDDGGMP